MKGIGIDTESFIAIKSNECLLKENIKRILYTRKGERPNRPDFGVGVEEFLFADMDYEVKKILKEEIIDQLTKYEPRIAITNISFFQTNTNSIRIVLQYYTREFFKGDNHLVLDI